MKLYNAVDWPGAPAGRQRARLRGAHARGPRGAAPGQARLPAEGRGAWYSRVGRPGEQASAPRERDALPRGSSAPQRAVPLLEKWADPKEKLPSEGAQPPFPETWATAQSALRYLGWTREPRAWGILEKQLHRRMKKLDVSWASLQQGGLTILGMTLRALGVGAADRVRAVGRLEGLPGPHGSTSKIRWSTSRPAWKRAWRSSWVASERSDEGRREEGPRHHEDGRQGQPAPPVLPRDARAPPGAPDASAGLVDLAKARPRSTDLEVRNQVARAIGMGGITPADGARRCSGS